MVDWDSLWQVTSQNAIISGIVSGVIVNELTKMMDRNEKKKIGVENAYFQEKNIRFGEKMMLELQGAEIKPKDRIVPGKHIEENYVYAETGLLIFSLKNNIKRLNGVTLIYSNDDKRESIDSISEFCNSLKYERLHQKSRSENPVFKSKCDICYISHSKQRIKNFLVCVDGAKKGYDLFVLQILQSPLGKYSSEFSIDNSGSVTEYSIEIPRVFTKIRDIGITSRIIKLNQLEKMMEPFIINNREFMPGVETKFFKLFIDSFKAAYDLRKVNIKKSDNG